MKRFTCMFLILSLTLCLMACGKKPGEVVTENETTAPANILPDATPIGEPTPATTAEPAPVPMTPELPPVWDEDLNAVLDEITDSVRPGSSGCSLRAVACAAHLLDWAHCTSLSDDEIYSAVNCWMKNLDSERLKMYLDSILDVYDACYDLRTDSAEELMESAGLQTSAWPWGDAAFHRVEMVSYACGTR